MLRKPLVFTALVLLAGFVLTRAVFHWVNTGQPRETASIQELALPVLGDADYDWIGSRIYQNETGGLVDKLTHWNEGEDFPSLGIGHFIWFPQAVDAPFDEQFPSLLAYLGREVPESLPMPAWLQELDPLDAPWSSKAQFDAARSSSQMSELRQWLDATRPYQARFIVSAFERRWQGLEIPLTRKQVLTGLLQALLASPEGLFAVIDYYNFKGLGNNPRESYQGQGWGLLQVLEALDVMRMDKDECADIVTQFSEAAAGSLRLRVELSPPERNEARWLPGWLRRLDGYLEIAPGSTGESDCGFRVTPYLQNPAENAMTFIWLSKENRAGQLTVWKPADGGVGQGVLFDSRPVKAGALAYHPAEHCTDDDCRTSVLPYLHQVRVTDLEPDTQYEYQVKQHREQADGRFSTPDEGDRPLRFIVYADSETEPESTGKHTDWSGGDGSAGPRKYPVDQSTGYAWNLAVIRERQPSFVAIAGDLVQSGGEQRDWDEFWLHNAGLAASVVLLPALGNHDYFGGPGDLGKYATADSERAVRKYQTYFDLPGNGASDAAQSERYYSLRIGRATLIVLDTTDGLPHRSDMDTNWRLRGEGDGGFAPDWQPGSQQHAWLLEELGKAQEIGGFTFVMFHHAPYTSGVHGQPPGESPSEDILSALPLQSLTPLFLRYGVDAVFSGHDEMYEHSVLRGTETTPDGKERAHEVHFYDIGIGGDGLRGPLAKPANPYRVFLAHTDAPEVYDRDGVLQDGGKHYGHLEVNIERNPDGIWQARMDPVYIFPIMAADGRVSGFERRVYADPVTLVAY